MKTNILTHLLYLYGQGNNFERVSNLMVKFLGSQFWGSEKGFAVFHQYGMQIPFIPHLPIKHLPSPVLSHRTVTVGGTEFSNVLAHYLQFVFHGPDPGFGFGKSGPQKMKSKLQSEPWVAEGNTLSRCLLGGRQWPRWAWPEEPEQSYEHRGKSLPHCQGLTSRIALPLAGPSLALPLSSCQQ